MILVLEKNITEAQRKRLDEELRSENCIIKEIQGVEETIMGVVGKVSRDIRYYENLPGVSKAIPISKPYKLVSRELHPEPTVVQVGDVAVGGDRLVVIAGPCGVEGRERTLDIARAVRKSGAVLFRGGAFKPRTSPYSFQGMGEEGLKILAEVREETGLGIVTEIVAPSQIDLAMKYVDVLQIGARNMQNFELLKSVGASGESPCCSSAACPPPSRNGSWPPSTSCPRATSRSSCAKGASGPSKRTPETPWTSLRYRLSSS